MSFLFGCYYLFGLFSKKFGLLPEADKTPEYSGLLFLMPCVVLAQARLKIHRESRSDMMAKAAALGN